MSIEQRVHPRQPLIEETIYFCEERAGRKIERIHYQGTLLNISQGGVGMRVSHPHEHGEQIWLEGIEGKAKAQPGRVCWIKANGEESFDLGIEFY